jgi:hypothetical protein
MRFWREKIVVVKKKKHQIFWGGTRLLCVCLPLRVASCIDRAASFFLSFFLSFLFACERRRKQ